MLGTHGRSITKAVFTPPARLLARLGVTPDQVTVTGSLLSIGVAIATLPFGRLWQGAVLLGVVLFADSMDGTLARLTTGGSRFGAFLDSTLDRLADGAVFASLAAYAALTMPQGTMRTWTLVAALVSTVGAAAVPYARARAESIGVDAKAGIAERTDRLVIALVGAGFTGFGWGQWWLALALSWVAFASLVTVIQRIAQTRRALASDSGPAAADE